MSKGKRRGPAVPNVDEAQVPQEGTEASEAEVVEEGPEVAEEESARAPEKPKRAPAREKRTQGVRARPDEEVWENTGAGKVHVRVADPRRPKGTRVHTVEGHGRIRLSTEEREYNSMEFFEAHKDPFRNGVLRRLDVPTEEKPLDPEYKEDQALYDADLVALLAKSGNAFQAAVKGLDQRNCERMRELVNADDSPATQAQRKFVNDHFKRTFVKDHTPTFSKEIREELAQGIR